MKKLLLLALLSGYAMAGTSVDACKVFIAEAHEYKETMKNNEMSKATLVFYKNKVVSHCGNIVAKETYDRNFFAKEMMKNTIATKDSCKVAIHIAKEYQNTTKFTSNIIVNAYKENVIDNCGTLVAKKASAFCLYDTQK